MTVTSQISHPPGSKRIGLGIDCTYLVFGNNSSLIVRSEEHTSELQSLAYLVCRLLLEKKNFNVLPQHDINNTIHHRPEEHEQWFLENEKPLTELCRSLVPDRALTHIRDDYTSPNNNNTIEHRPEGDEKWLLENEKTVTQFCRKLAAERPLKDIRDDYNYPKKKGSKDECSRLLDAFFFNATATTEIYTLSLHDALPI